MFLQILAPFASHITEELWSSLGEKKSIHKSVWPKYNSKKIIDAKIKIAVQVNGKVRHEIMVNKDATEAEVILQISEEKSLIPWIENKEIKRVIYVPGRILNIVI